MKSDETLSLPGVRSGIPVEIFRPRGSGPWPAVLVLHEVMGLNADIRRIARRFAENGYLAACPDLMADGSRIRCIRAALQSLQRGEGAQVRQLNAAIDMLKARPDTSDVGVAGFCMGGGFATLLATQGEVDAAAVFYGDIRPKEELKGACPIVGGYGALDKTFVRKGEKLRQRLTEYGVPNDIEIYADAGHCYMNKAVPDLLVPIVRPFFRVDYNEAAAEDSWRRMLAFFGQHLRSELPAPALNPA